MEHWAPALLAAALLFSLWASSAGALLVEGVRGIVDAARDPVVSRALRFSTLQALASAGAAVLLALPLAYLNSTYDYPGRSLVETLVALPFTLPTVSVALAFLLLVRAGLVPQGWIAIVLAHAYFNFGVCAQMISASLGSVGPSIEEAAETLGAGPLARFFRVTLPLALRGIAAGFSLTFSLSFTSFAIPLLLGGPRYRTLEVEIYSLYKVFLDADRASAAALIQLAATMGVAWASLRWSPVGVSGEVRRRRPLVGSQAALAAVYGYASAALSIYPVAYLFVRSLFDPLTDRFNPTVYARILSTAYDASLGTEPFRGLLNSAFFAATTAVVTLSLAALVASAPPKARSLALGVSSLPLGTSSITAALGLYALGLRLRAPGWSLIAASHIMIAAPFAMRAVESGVSGLSESLVDAAETLGLSRLDATFRVLLPAAAPAVLSGAFYSLALSLSETAASALLASPATQTMTVVALRYAGVRRFQEAAAVSSLVALLTWGALWAKQIAEGRMGWLRSS
ncbi:MAG: ABC transporter permease subunit [Candidatus Korarchaeota archaeon]|nr:ABC transporter permease subunit [Candidatus Korarchaeota archaeon]